MADAACTDPSWLITPHGITQHHVKIIWAVQVSAGSWMPILQLTGYAIQSTYLSNIHHD
jgi:hypothetical protein